MYNGHADVTALVDGGGVIQATYYYDEFGNVKAKTGTVSNPYGYSGYKYDEETGLYYLNARMYDPSIARFIQEDSYRGSKDDPLSLNLYTYCSNEPIMYDDPSGHMRAAYTDENGVYHADPDAEEFGKDSITYKALLDLTKGWKVSNKTQKKDIESLADNVRYVTRDIRFGVKKDLYEGFLKSKKLNNTEIVLSIAYTTDALTVNQCSNIARNEENVRFKTPDNGVNITNAFKHAYWNALMTQTVGEYKAKLFGDAHEYGDTSNLLASNRIVQEMDLYNNNVGRNIGIQYTEKTQEELARIVFDSVKNGNMVRVKRTDKVQQLVNTAITNASNNEFDSYQTIYDNDVQY